MKPFIYNVTVKVSHSIQADWLRWMQEEHMNEVVATGCFTQCRLFHLIESDDSQGVTYAAQYEASNKEQYERYLREFADAMRKKGFDKWGDAFIAFRTAMQVI